MLQVKNEIKKQIISFCMLVTSLIFAQYFPISNMIYLSNDTRANWAIDTAFYSLIINSVATVIIYVFDKRKLHVSLKLENALQDGVENLTTTQEPCKVLLELEIRGKSRNIGAPFLIQFPDWLDIQPRKEHFLKLKKQNCLSIDVDKIINGKKYVQIKRRIYIDIISNTDEQYEEFTDIEHSISWLKGFYSIKLNYNRIKIKNKWG